MLNFKERKSFTQGLESNYTIPESKKPWNKVWNIIKGIQYKKMLKEYEDAAEEYQTIFNAAIGMLHRGETYANVEQWFIRKNDELNKKHSFTIPADEVLEDLFLAYCNAMCK